MHSAVQTKPCFIIQKFVVQQYCTKNICCTTLLYNSKFVVQQCCTTLLYNINLLYNMLYNTVVQYVVQHCCTTMLYNFVVSVTWPLAKVLFWYRTNITVLKIEAGNSIN